MKKQNLKKLNDLINKIAFEENKTQLEILKSAIEKLPLKMTGCRQPYQNDRLPSTFSKKSA